MPARKDATRKDGATRAKGTTKGSPKAARKPATSKAPKAPRKPAASTPGGTPRASVAKARATAPAPRDPMRTPAGAPTRELARPDGGARKPAARNAADADVAARAREVLQGEFERALAIKEKLAAEASIGGREKGRAMDRAKERLRSLVASLEGMHRFAIAMGLVTPAESRALYAEAIQRGLYEGWK